MGARPRGRGGGINVLAPLAPASRWIGSETGINAASGRRGGIWVEERWKGRDEDGRDRCQRQLRPRSPRGRGGCAAARRHRALPSFLPDGAGRLRAPGPAAAPGARPGAAKSPAGQPGTEPPPPGRDAPVARGHPSAAGSAGADAERSEAAAAAATDGAGGDTAPAKRGSAAAPPAAPPAARHGTARRGGGSVERPRWDGQGAPAGGEAAGRAALVGGGTVSSFRWWKRCVSAAPAAPRAAISWGCGVSADGSPFLRAPPAAVTEHERCARCHPSYALGSGFSGAAPSRSDCGSLA